MRRSLTLILLLAVALPLGALERQPNQAYKARRQALAARLNNGVIVMFAPLEAEGPNAIYGFRQDNDFYYLTGLVEPGAALLIAAEMPGRAQNPPRPYTEILFLPERNVTQEKWTGPKLTAEDPRAREKTGFDLVKSLDDLRDELVRVMPQPAALVYSDLPDWDQESASVGGLQYQRRANAFPNYVSFGDVKPALAELRKVKDADEVKFIRHAVEATTEGLKSAMHAIRPGMTENQVAWLIQYEYGRRGCERPAFAPIVGAGFNSTVLHYSKNSGTIQDGDLVLMDVGGEYSMYAADVTRTVPANGKFNPRQREIYEIVLGAQQAAIDAFESGKSTLARTGSGSLYQVAFEYINSHGKDRHGNPLGRYFIHGLSHFVGLAVHDVGDGSKPLGPGMVFTIEPGIYIPEESLGVRIEDTFYVDENGKLVNLSADAPRTVEEVEAGMAEEQPAATSQP